MFLRGWATFVGVRKHLAVWHAALSSHTGAPQPLPCGDAPSSSPFRSASRPRLTTTPEHPVGTMSARGAPRRWLNALPPHAPSTHASATSRAFCAGPARLSRPDRVSPTAHRETHFGYQTVTEGEKQDRVAGVFHSVAESYDKMNDLMSLGVHRLWKCAAASSCLCPAEPLAREHFVSSLNPGATNPAARPQRILDVAGGTGDIAFRMLRRAHDVNANPNVHVTVSDINPSMLAVGRQRSLHIPAPHQASLSFLEANAEALPPSVHDASLDLYTVAFGIRNFSNIPAALREAHRVLKPGGVFACLEFSKVDKYPLLNALYKQWSFSAIPLIGQLVAADRDSYQYLVESIERFPSQVDFRDMIVDAGFAVAGDGYEDLTGGIAAIHKGIKPL